MKISVIIPLYNEEGNVALLQQQLEESLCSFDHEVIFIDDASTDQTLSNIKPSDSTRTLHFSSNRGQSAAMYCGIQAATGEIIVTLDGDLQNDPADIPSLIETVQQGFDLVCGYRKNRQDSFSKKIQSKIANSIRSALLGDGIRDTGCSLKAMKLECRQALVPFNGMHRFMPALIRASGFSVTEIPVNHRPRIHGVSKYGFGNRALRGLLDLFGVAWLIKRRVNTQQDPMLQ
jgi:dolichol-phosphate mannosyltransferase